MAAWILPALLLIAAAWLFWITARAHKAERQRQKQRALEYLINEYIKVACRGGYTDRTTACFKRAHLNNKDFMFLASVVDQTLATKANMEQDKHNH